MPKYEQTQDSPEAHLFLASPDDWTSATCATNTLALLSEEERERHRSMGHPRAQDLFLTGRALVRSALSHFSGTEPTAWVFETGQHGRPRISEQSASRSMDFNLAHTDRLVACLVTRGLIGGVDVESTQRSLDPMRMAEHSFAPEEAEDLEHFEGQARQDQFLSYWTLKEAYLKARGAGFSLLLDAAAFRFTEAQGVSVRFAPRTEDAPGDWQFALFRAPGEHLVAVALRNDPRNPVPIVTRWAEPAAAPDYLSKRPIVLETAASTRGPAEPS